MRIFYHYLQMHLMRMKSSFSLLTASPQVLLGLKYCHEFFYDLLTKKGVILLLQLAAFENGHVYESINSMIDNFTNLSKLPIIIQKKDCTFRWYNLHLLKFCQFLKVINYCWVGFFLKHPQ